MIAVDHTFVVVAVKPDDTQRLYRCSKCGRRTIAVRGVLEWPEQPKGGCLRDELV